ENRIKGLFGSFKRAQLLLGERIVVNAHVINKPIPASARHLSVDTDADREVIGANRPASRLADVQLAVNVYAHLFPVLNAHQVMPFARTDPFLPVQNVVGASQGKVIPVFRVEGGSTPRAVALGDDASPLLGNRLEVDPGR